MNTTPETIDLTSQPKTSKFISLGVADAAQAIRTGQITAEAYASDLLQQSRVMAGLDTFIRIDEDTLLADARKADKALQAGSTLPLLGVPLGVKDSYLTHGLATSLGLKDLANFVPTQDAGAVRAIKDAGALVFGKNNLVEMSFGLTGNNAHFGQVKNPHAPNRVTGGSSSGSAASVAAGIVPASLGGDTIGSIRVPAALCGVVGFKPTTGRWPRDGVAPVSHTLDTTGVIARSVADCALIDQVVTGDVLQAEHDLKGVRLAYAPRQFLEGCDAQVEARFREVLRQLKDTGAEIVEVDLGEDFAALSQSAARGIFFHETQGAITEFLRLHQFPTQFETILERLKPELRDAWSYMVVPQGAGAISPDIYQEILNVNRPEIQRRLDQVFVARGAQAILQPTTPCTAPLIAQQTNFLVGGREVDQLVLANHTVVASLLGLPGISLPAGLSTEGLPIGLELDSPSGSDRRLLALAQRIESVLSIK